MSDTQTSVEIAVRNSSDLAALTDLEKILLSPERPEVVDDPEEISREIVMQLLGAESNEELEQFGQAEGWRELEDVPMEIHGFRWRPSQFKEGAPVFFVVTATRLDDGSKIVLTTGAMNVLAALVNLAKRGEIPGAIRAIHRAENPTERGYYPLWLYTPDSIKESAKAGK